MEGEIILKYAGECEDFINIMLKNGYTLTIELKENIELRILYYKPFKELEGRHGYKQT